LAQHLGVGAWLKRTADALNSAPNAELAKPSYNTDITIKFGGSGSYTYSFAHGIDLASLSGSYELDEQLNISIAAIPEKKTIQAVTLPDGERFNGLGKRGGSPVRSIADIDAAKNTINFMQLEQAISKIQRSNQ
jgi:hypothetical protein